MVWSHPTYENICAGWWLSLAFIVIVFACIECSYRQLS